MSTTESTPAIDQLMQGFKEPLTERLEGLEAERRELIEAHREKLATMDAEIGRYRRILRAAFPDEFTPDRKAEREAAHVAPAPRTSVGAEKLDKIRTFVLRHLAENDTISQVEVRLQLGYDSSTVSTAFQLFREEGLLRQSGQIGNRKFFRLTKDALETLEEQNGSED